MGTTESIFYDDAAARQEAPTGRGSATTPTGLQRETAAQFTPAQPRPHPGAASMPSRRTIISQGVVSPGGSRHGTPRPPTSTTTIQLSGLVLGLSGSGKQTLLQRLEGKEPDFTRKDIDSVAMSEESSLRVAEAPYRAPGQAFDDAIRLRVQATRNVPKTKDAFDFFVIAIDPRRNPAKTEKYLTKLLQSALRAQGYGNDGSSSRPLCLCLLRSFQDIVSSKNEKIIESDLTGWTLQVLQEYPNLDDANVVLQCTDTSLVNCYGLGQLHHFIYQAYLQRKRYDLQQKLKAVHEAQSLARQEAPASESYEEYCQSIVTAEQGATPNPKARRKDDETTTTSSSKNQPRIRASSGESTLPSTQQSAKDALEAFLESDSESEDDVLEDERELHNDSEEFYVDKEGRGDADHGDEDSAEETTKEISRNESRKESRPECTKELDHDESKNDNVEKPQTSDPNETAATVKDVAGKDERPIDGQPRRTNPSGPVDESTACRDHIKSTLNEDERSDPVEHKVAANDNSDDDDDFFIEESPTDKDDDDADTPEVNENDTKGAQNESDDTAEAGEPSLPDDSANETKADSSNDPAIEPVSEPPAAENAAASTSQVTCDTELTDEARAALEAAKADFERMLQESDANPEKINKKKTKKSKTKSEARAKPSES